MSSKSINESRVSLVNDGSVGSNTQKIIQQREKQLIQRDKKIVTLEAKIEKLQVRLKKKEDKKTTTLLKKKKKNLKIKTKIYQTGIKKLMQRLFLLHNYLVKYILNSHMGVKNIIFQALLEVELQRKGFIVQSEVAVLCKVASTSGEVLQLPHDIRGREDLLLPQEKMILELKQTRGLGDPEQQQLLRYMYQRHSFSEWSDETKGMLINFGDDDLEIWFVQFNDKGDTDHIRLMKLPRIINKSWETNSFKMTT